MPPPWLLPVFSLPGYGSGMRPRISDMSRYGNLNPLSVDYASRPRLRSTYPGQISFTLETLDIRPEGFSPSSRYSFRHSLFMTLHSSLSVKLLRVINAPLPIISDSRASVSGFSPGHFRRGTSRLVSYYALFERMAASEPTS